jgi:tRNA threonylcarbamoyladenosine biosynthesis protein TsaB
MKLLAIDTSGAACSAALLQDDRISQRFELAPRRHGELILAMAAALLADAGLGPGDLDAVAFGRGPGSFTGLRIAAAVAQGIAFGADLPVIGVSTLAALAQGCRRRSGADHVLCALDARMQEVYWGAYAADAAGLMRPLDDERVCSPEAVVVPRPAPAQGWVFAGSGWEAYREALSAAVGDAPLAGESELACEARDIAMLAADAYERGDWVEAEAALPVYLRNRVADPKPGA